MMMSTHPCSAVMVEWMRTAVLLSLLLTAATAMKERVIAEPAKQGTVNIVYSQDRKGLNIGKAFPEQL